VSKASNHVKEQLSAYIDDVLSDEERALVEKELASCATCRENADFMSGIINTAKSLPELDITEDFRVGLRERLEQEKTAKVPVRWSYWRYVSGFAAAAAVLVLSVITLNSLPEHLELTSETDPKQVTINRGLSTELRESGGIEPDSIASAAPTEEAHGIIYSAAGEKAEAAQNTSAPASLPEMATAPRNENNQKAEGQTAEKITATDDKTFTDIAEEPALETADEKGGVPMRTSLYDTNQQSSTDAAAADSETATPAAVPESMKASTGVGGSAHLARTNTQQAEAICYYFSPEALESARQLLVAYPEEDGGFIVPEESLPAIQESLEALPGYIRRTMPEQETISSEIKMMLCVE